MGAHSLIVIAAEEGIETCCLCSLRYGEKLAITGTLLWFGKDAEFHAFTLLRGRVQPIMVRYAQCFGEASEMSLGEHGNVGTNGKGALG